MKYADEQPTARNRTKSNEEIKSKSTASISIHDDDTKRLISRFRYIIYHMLLVKTRCRLNGT